MIRQSTGARQLRGPDQLGRLGALAIIRFANLMLRVIGGCYQARYLSESQVERAVRVSAWLRRTASRLILRDGSRTWANYKAGNTEPHGEEGRLAWRPRASSGPSMRGAEDALSLLRNGSRAICSSSRRPDCGGAAEISSSTRRPRGRRLDPTRTD
jgi:hypothetical protein